MKKEKVNGVILLLSFIFYLFVYCFGFIYTPLRNVFSVINLLIILLLIFNNRKEFLKKKKNLILLLFLFIVLVLCKLITNTGYGSILQIVNLMLIIMLIPIIKIKYKFLMVLKYMFPVFYIIFLFVSKIHLNPNYVGYIFFCSYILSVALYNLDRKDNRILLIIFTVLTAVFIHLFKCRTALMCTIFYFLLLLIPFKVYEKKSIKKLLPIVFTFISFLFAIIYVSLWKAKFLVGISTIFGKSFYSGRNRIWNEILPLLLKYPFFGVGSKYVLTSFPAYALHNSVFMISLTFGIPCLILFYVNIKNLFKSLFNQMRKNYTNKIVIVSLMMFLFVDVFESYIYWSNFNFLFFIIMIVLLNRNILFEDKKVEKKSIYIFEEGIDRMGGVERVISTLSNNFIKNYNVNVISFYKTKDKPYFDYDKNVNISYLLERKVQRSKKYNHGTVKYYLFRLIEKCEDFVVLRHKIANILSKVNDNDVIILGRIDVALKVLPYLDRNKKVIVRDAIHYLYYNKKIQSKIRRVLPKKVSTLIVSSEESKKIYLEIFKNKDIKIMKVYNPLGIIPNVKYNFDNKTILSVGRYSTQKGFENLIKSFKLVNNKHNDWSLRIVGADSNELKKLISKLDLEDKVSLISDSKDVVSELNNASLFVMTSRYDGYANALVEALACGVPSITYDWLLGADDIIVNNETGVIVNLEDRFDYAKNIDNSIDVKKLSKAINMLIEDKNICDNFSKKSSDLIWKTRNIDTILEAWEDEIND